LRLVADEGIRRQVTQAILSHGLSPDSLYVEDALVLLDFADLLDDEIQQQLE